MINGLFCCDCRANMIRKEVAARCCSSACRHKECSAPFCKSCFARRAGIDGCATATIAFVNASYDSKVLKDREKKEKEEEEDEKEKKEDQVYLQAILFHGEPFTIAMFCNECIDDAFLNILAKHFEASMPKNRCIETMLRDHQLGLPHARATFENAARFAPSLVGCKVVL